MEDSEDECDATTVVQVPVKRKRKRAVPNNGNLDPGMQCPLGPEQLRIVADVAAVGLCGPSELRHSLPRTRYELVDTPHVRLPMLTPSAEAGADLAAILYAKLRYMAQDTGMKLLTPRVGRADVTELVLSFLLETRPLTATATGGWMHCDTGSANLDFFFQAVPQSSPAPNHQLHQLLEEAWAESPETCLRQIFLLGASREGKQDRYSFYDAMLWLWDRQPATVLQNLHLIPEANYWKGLLEFLARVCEGPRRSFERDQALHESYLQNSRKLLAPGRAKYAKEGWKPGSRLELAREALKRYDTDPVYRALFERTGQLFADQLREDLDAMRAGKQVGLCSKWCPTLYHSFDRRTLICESIARHLFPPSLPEFAGASERNYAYRARDRLRGVLAELREYTKTPERLMCQGRWSDISYKAVPAMCLKINSKKFLKHDTKRFLKHLDSLVQGKVMANTGALQPHEILKSALPNSSMAFDPVGPAIAQAQWQALVAEVKEFRTLEGCVAVCDVSGSMMVQAAAGVSCLDVAVSLSLLLTEVADGPYARKLITFHEDPQLISLPESRQLADLARFVCSQPWGMSTNFYKVFNLLLPMKPPPKRVFVFSDMQFSSAGGQATDLQKARKLYDAAGVPMPQLVFWNLQSHAGAPAVADDVNVALVSGFSSVMMKLLLQEGVTEPVVQQRDPQPTKLEIEDVVVEADEVACPRDEEQEEDEEDNDNEEKEGNEKELSDADGNEEDEVPEQVEHAREQVSLAVAVPVAQGKSTGHGGGNDDGEDELISTAAGSEEPVGIRPEAELKALRVLANALDKPVLRRPRVVDCVEEALQLFRGCRQPVCEWWAAEALAEEAMQLPAPQPSATATSSRWTTQSLHIGTLPCKEAIAAFLGRSVQELRSTLHMALQQELKTCKRGLRLWLDVVTSPLQPPALENGEVVVTAKARFAPSKLQAALEQLLPLTKEAICDALMRAENLHARM